MKQHKLLLCSVFLVLLAGCVGTQTRVNVLLPALEVAWPGIRTDAIFGGATDAQLNMFEAALEDGRIVDMAIYWPVLKEAAEAGIRIRTDVSEGVKASLRERVRLFDEGMKMMIGRRFIQHDANRVPA